MIERTMASCLPILVVAFCVFSFTESTLVRKNVNKMTTDTEGSVNNGLLQQDLQKRVTSSPRDTGNLVRVTSSPRDTGHFVRDSEFNEIIFQYLQCLRMRPSNSTDYLLLDDSYTDRIWAVWQELQKYRLQALRSTGA